jgi:predicted RNA-binding Zn-ribbon protein involved in translation (DUF1610 family)
MKRLEEKLLTLPKTPGVYFHKAAAGFLSERLTHILLPRLARADNWPLCPGCGEDELYDLSTPPLATNTLRCYRCGWAGTIQKEKTHV